MRPVPFPSRCALRFAVKLPVICASAEVIASLLVICVILQTGFGSQVSESETDTLTGTSLLFGGHSTLGLAVTDEITGGVVSCTLTVELQLPGFPDPSATLHEKGVEPSAKVEPEVGLQIGVCRPGQLSDAVGLNETAAPAGEVHSATGAGQEIVGSCLSTIVTLALQDAESFSVSVTVNFTDVTPNPYGPAGD